jgi:hypothetical protein
LASTCDKAEGPELEQILASLSDAPHPYSTAAVARFKVLQRRLHEFRSKHAEDTSEETPRFTPPGRRKSGRDLVVPLTVGLSLVFLLWGARHHFVNDVSHSVGNSRSVAFFDLSGASLAEVIRRTHTSSPPERRDAVYELGRRGALDELERLAVHEHLDVRAEAPLAMLLAGKAAHARVPHLAERLSSPDVEVRRNASIALRRLVAQFGVYHEGQPEQLQARGQRGTLR